MYYIYGRDAVGAKLINEVAATIVAQQRESDDLSEYEETRTFWCIAGLIESGHLEYAEELIRKYHPSDLRLLMCLQIGAFYVEHVQFTTDEQKKIAKKIATKIGPQVSHLIKDVLREMKSVVLEVQEGEVKALEGPVVVQAADE